MWTFSELEDERPCNSTKNELQEHYRKYLKSFITLSTVFVSGTCNAAIKIFCKCLLDAQH